jgi:hypothetical protein
MDKSLYGRLKRLFSSNVVVRRVGKDKFKVIDSNKIQSVGNLHNSRFIDRFTRLHGTRSHSLSTYSPALNYFSSKTELYTDYEVMDMDSIIASALDIYADETVMKDDSGNVLSIRSDDDNIKKILSNLFYDVLNVDFNLWPWVRNMCKYGDFYLKLDIQEGIGIANIVPLSAYEIVRDEGTDPMNPYLVQFKHIGGGNFTYENYEIAHFRLLTDSNFLPYGKSIIEPARKVWKQLTLMEDAMLIHRIMRAPEKRIFKVDVGNIPPNEVDAYMQRIINGARKVPYVDQQTGEYNLKFNLMNMMEDYFLPTRGAQSSTEIDTLPGMEFTGIDDIEYLRNRMMAALKVPKAFLGYEEGIQGKGTLASEDVRFARTIERVQRIVVSELTKIAIVHLYAQGFEDADLVNFEITMTAPSIIYEQEKITFYNSKVDLAKSMIEGKLMSRDWIYKNIFNFAQDEIENLQIQIVDDQKEAFRMEKIVSEGEDPAAAPPKPEEGEAEGEAGGEAEEETPTEEGGEGTTENPFGESKRAKVKVPPGGWPGAGRPKEPIHYNTRRHPRGDDPIGHRSMNAESIAVTKSRLNLNKLSKKSSKLLKETGMKSMLDENNLLNDDF